MNRFSLGAVAVLTLGVLAVPACGGSSESTPDPGTGGSGGVLIPADSSDQSVDGSAGTDAGPTPDTWAPDTAEAAPDAAPDTSVDSPPPDISQPDAPVDQQVLEGSLFDLTIPDVVLNDTGATAQTCYDCATKQCTSALAACDKDDKCRSLILCMFTDMCFDPSGTYGVNLSCAMGCFGKSGITGLGDPAAQLGMDVASCIAGKCQTACGLPPDAGMPPMDGAGPG
jgi:hypothetical protein